MSCSTTVVCLYVAASDQQLAGRVCCLNELCMLRGVQQVTCHQIGVASCCFLTHIVCVCRPVCVCVWQPPALCAAG